MTDTQAIAAEPEAIPGGNSPQGEISAGKPLLVFVLFVILIMAGGYFVFHRYKDEIKADKQNELAGIAELKAGQITNWMTERRGDAQSIRDDNLFVLTVDHWLRQGRPAGKIKAQLTARLASMQQTNASYGYTSISLFDDKAVLQLSTAADEEPIQGQDKMRLLESMRSGQIVFSEIHREKTALSDKLEIELRAPLILVENGKARTVGAILFRIDPYRFVFPLIQHWPTPSPSAESLLVRRAGDEVVFLNELRHRKNTALAMRLPLSNGELPSVMAALGQVGMVEGVDYRGVPVVAVLNKIPGTAWAMVSKIDQAEIYAPINSLSRWTVMLMLALIGAGGGATAYWWQKQRQNIRTLEKQHAQELERQALGKHLDYLAKYANDIILLHDGTGKIVEFNDRAPEAYGYSAAEFSELNMANIRAVQLAPSFADKRREIDLAGAQRFESVHVRKNGNIFPVETSVRKIDIAGKSFYQAIIRDITERKQAEVELARQNDFIRLVIDSDPNFIFVKNAEGRFLLANKAMAESYGQTTASIVGKHNADFVHNPEQIAAYESASRKVIESRQERLALETGSLADGKSRIYQTLRKPLVQTDGSVNVLTIAMDVTQLKQAEERLRRLNRSLRLLSECNAAMIHSEEEKGLLEEICQLIVKVGGYRMTWVGFAGQDVNKTVRPVARYGYGTDYLDTIAISWSDDVRGLGPIGAAVKTGLTQVNHDSSINPAMAHWRDAALARGYLSSIALPLKVHGETIGVLTIYAAQANAFYTEEILLLEDLADDLAFGIAAQRLRAERNRAEALLESERVQLRTLVQTIPDLVWLKDANGVYLNCNLQFERFFGAKEADIVGKTDYDFVEAELAEHFRQKDREAMAAGKPSINEEWITYPDNGERALLETIKTPMLDEAGALIGVMGIARNITGRRRAEERESRLNHILDSTLDMIFIFQPDSLRFVYMNKGAIDSTGYSREELLRMTSLEINLLMSEAEFRNFIAPLVAGEKQILRVETLLRHKNGTDFPVEVQLQLVQEKDGESVFVAVVRDIAERKRAEKILRRQKAFMWKVIDADPNQIFVKDAQGNFLLVNRSLASAYGLSPKEMVGRNNAEINLFPEEVAAYLAADRQVIEDGREISLVEPFTLPDGEQRWFLTLKKRLEMPDGRLSVLGIAVDITEQKQSELKLAESYKKLQRLSMHLENIRADERARIALNLHDEMGATLVAIKMGIAWLASRLPADTPQLASEVSHLSELVAGGIHTMRQIVTELRPNLLGDVGLAAAIKDYVNKFRQHSIIECVLVLPEREFALDAEQSLTIFRILQESLNNVAKHAQASRVNIRFTEREEGLSMEIEDNGVGFALSAHKEHTFGLLGIRERALMVGGKARILSAPGKGTCVSVSISYASSSLDERDSHEV